MCPDNTNNSVLQVWHSRSHAVFYQACPLHSSPHHLTCHIFSTSLHTLVRKCSMTWIWAGFSLKILLHDPHMVIAEDFPLLTWHSDANNSILTLNICQLIESMLQCLWWKWWLWCIQSRLNSWPSATFYIHDINKLSNLQEIAAVKVHKKLQMS